jgi:multiple sugar transport system permease protein
MQPTLAIRLGFILPAMLVVVGTTLWPLASALTTSFRDWRLKRSPVPQKWVGLDNYVLAVEEPEFWNALKVTGVFVTLDVVLTVALSLGLALLLRRTGALQSLVKAVLILPFAMSPALIGVSFRFMFNGEFGVFSKGIGWLIPPLADVVWLANPTTAMLALVFSDVWHWFPYMTLVILGGLATLPPEQEEAALLDGASTWQNFRFVVLPHLMPVLAIIAILKTIFALKMFDQVVTLTGAGPGITTQTLAHYVFTVGFVHYDMGHASSLAFILTAILMLVAVVYVRRVLPAGEAAHA